MKVIVTSKFWRPVLSQIWNHNRRIGEFVVFGSPFDGAVAANTKFDILFAKKSQKQKMTLIFGILIVESLTTVL